MLARDLGMTVEELGQRMDAMEYHRWIALYEIERREMEQQLDRAKAGR